MTPKRLTIHQMRIMRAQLREAERDLLIYADPANEDCGVPAAAREASRLYIDSWGVGPIRRALRTLDVMLGDAPESNEETWS